MKRITLLTGVLSGLILLSLSCELSPPLDTHNDIQYPVLFQLATEIPGEPITLVVSFAFDDQTPDTSGVMFYWDITGDTLRFVLEGTDGDIERADTFSNYRPVNVGALEAGSYTLLFENGGNKVDTFWFEIEDSVYRLQTDSGNVIFTPTWKPNELRRIFPDMLLVEVGAREAGIDSIRQALIELGAVESHVRAGTYTMFNVYGSDSTWAVAGSREGDDWDLYLDYAGSLLFTYDGDTMRLDSFFKSPPVNVGALSIRMGNGFDRYYRWWVE